MFDPATGERIEVELFVGVLGASNLTYAEATLAQRVHDFVSVHVRMLEYFGGATEVVVPDQLRSAVSMPGRYEPTIQRTYAERELEDRVLPSTQHIIQAVCERYGSTLASCSPGEAQPAIAVQNV